MKIRCKNSNQAIPLVLEHDRRYTVLNKVQEVQKGQKVQKWQKWKQNLGHVLFVLISVPCPLWYFLDGQGTKRTVTLHPLLRYKRETSIWGSNFQHFATFTKICGFSLGYRCYNSRRADYIRPEPEAGCIPPGAGCRLCSDIHGYCSCCLCYCNCYCRSRFCCCHASYSRSAASCRNMGLVNINTRWIYIHKGSLNNWPTYFPKPGTVGSDTTKIRWGNSCSPGIFWSEAEKSAFRGPSGHIHLGIFQNSTRYNNENVMQVGGAHII